MQITFDRKTVNTCLQQKFVLPTYQRDYKWEAKHLHELLSDIQEAFLTCWKAGHGRKDVLGYESYFLGTIITTQVAQGGKAIVDGQQRVTTLTLLFAYIHRLRKRHPELNISPVEQAIRRQVAGQSEYNLDMDPSRHALFDVLIDGPADETELFALVESIPNKDSGTVRIWELYQQIESSLASEVTDSELLPHLFDFITECVCMFEIGVPREQDGHKVFVTMNDRGLKLGPIDLLKGFLLSSISTDSENNAAHSSWNECINKLKSLGSDEDSNFFKTWIRSKYANSSRGKKRGDAPGDFEVIGDSYHRWVMDNKELIGLKTSDDFSNLLTGALPYYVDLYCRIKRSEQNFQAGLPHVYYNGARDLTLQSMVILSAVKATDTTSVATKKIKSISYYLDHLATARAINGKENTYDNIRDIIFELTKELRDLDLVDLKAKLVARMDAERDKIENIKACSYTNMKRQDLLHILGRLSDYLEISLDMTNKVGFPDYASRTRDSRTFDIEHLIAHDIAATNADLIAAGGDEYATNHDFTSSRNNISGLILLPRSRNRSMKDMPYSAKLQRYSGENVLAQTLTESFYLNQPNWAKFSAESGIAYDSMRCVDAKSLKIRGEFYESLAKKIWSKQNLEAIFA
ncbi:DUF262 domain-containing protein [Pseudomonas putida]|uniref:DUF262 domain-containing protein n=1 Tax=Pseudomonas putida TaxID=303 RepID=UPI003132DBB7